MSFQVTTFFQNISIRDGSQRLMLLRLAVALNPNPEIVSINGSKGHKLKTPKSLCNLCTQPQTLQYVSVRLEIRVLEKDQVKTIFSRLF